LKVFFIFETMDFIKTTEQESYYDNLEHMSIGELIRSMNKEDQTVPKAVEKALPQVEALVTELVPRMERGGRLFYIGAGTSGRLGILDASECPPTYGVPHGLVVGLIAGGDKAIRWAVEHAEDSVTQSWEDLREFEINDLDTVIGIAASGTTPYVVSGIEKCRAQGILTGCITCNEGSPLDLAAEFPIVAVVGPEFVTGSSRMKAGTAQKLILNMISTSAMIRLGRIKGNRMVDMQLSNNKLIDRGTRMIMEELEVSQVEADSLLKKHKSVRGAIQHYQDGNR
jgi:N-acetylmuramic acid 6-phosphate etherase